MYYSHILIKPKIFDETKQIYSRWFKESLKKAGVNVEHYQGHSLRSAVASAAKPNGANISDLLLAGG